MQLNVELEKDFSWWKWNVLHRVSNITVKDYKLTIFSDASITEWGVSCGDSKTHGHWSASEKLHHINYLELLAAFFGLKCFVKEILENAIYY